MKRYLSRSPWVYAFLVILLLLAVAPVLAALAQSLFVNGELSGAAYGVALGQRQGLLLARTVGVGAGAALVAVAIGLPLGLVISRTNAAGRRLWWVLCFVPLIVPPYVMAVTWLELLAPQGLVNHFLVEVVHLRAAPLAPEGPLVVAASLGLSLWPVVAIISGAAAGSVDPDLEDAARLEASPWGVVRSVTLPLTAPACLAAALFVFLLAIVDLGTADVLYLRVYTTEVLALYAGSLDPAAGAAAAVPLTAVALLAAGATYGAARRWQVGLLRQRPVRDFDLGKWRLAVAGLCAAVLAAVLAAPLAMLLSLAGGAGSYQKALASCPRPLANSLLYASLATALAIVLALPMAYVLARPGAPGRRFAALASALPVAVPGALLALGLLIIWSRPWLLGGLEAAQRWPLVPLCFAARFAPFAIGAIAVVLAQVDVSLEEDALLAGASLPQLARHVVIPLAKRGILAGAAIVFILGMREWAGSVIIRPPGGDTLAVQLFEMLHYGAEELVAALAVILILVTLVPLGLSAIVWRRCD